MWANWRTNIIAVLKALTIIFGVVVNAIDSDPKTIADWNLVILAIFGLLSTASSFVGADAAKVEEVAKVVELKS